MAQDDDNSIGERYRSIVLKNFGGLDQIEVLLMLLAISHSYINLCTGDQIKESESKLTPDGNQVVVVVKACGLNFADIYTRQGLIRDMQPPFTLGLECAGVVKEVGQQVTQLKVSLVIT